MRELSFDLGNLRRALELSVERAEALALYMAEIEAPRAVLIETQDELSDAVANLAAYLLATGEEGWIGTARAPQPYGSMQAVELRSV